MELSVGKTYRIIHRTPEQKYPRESVLRFLEETAGLYFFDARPVAGTQGLPKEWVTSITPSPGARIRLNRVMRGRS